MEKLKNILIWLKDRIVDFCGFNLFENKLYFGKIFDVKKSYRDITEFPCTLHQISLIIGILHYHGTCQNQEICLGTLLLTKLGILCVLHQFLY